MAMTTELLNKIGEAVHPTSNIALQKFVANTLIGKVKMPKAKHPHQCLKVFELIGFIGSATDIELAMYILDNAMSLEKIIIDPRTNAKWDVQIAARAHAKKLETSLPPRADLVIL